MTPKQQYEARKAQRDERRQHESRVGRDVDNEEEMMRLLAERFVVAVERIADALAPEAGR